MACFIHDLTYYLVKGVYHRNKADLALEETCKAIFNKYNVTTNTADYDKVDSLSKRMLSDTVTVMYILEIKQMFGL
jgi:hypothetical protein